MRFPNFFSMRWHRLRNTAATSSLLSWSSCLRCARSATADSSKFRSFRTYHRNLHTSVVPHHSTSLDSLQTFRFERSNLGKDFREGAVVPFE